MGNFHVGQKVVCIDQHRPSAAASWIAQGIVPTYPAKGCVYTIRAIVFHSYTGAALLLLEEVVNVVPAGMLEPGFDAKHFRPVKTTSIEIFERLLVPHSNEELV